ncbi:hypothetical protein H8356DRAFT_591389 [Neocallimastix lanati (nom. inval.)]|nr:hypothetical protein H8356DRAFT_591389 [Neocallimastix sp. JGI-2020a]
MKLANILKTLAVVYTTIEKVKGITTEKPVSTTKTLLKLPPKTTSRPINVIPKPQEESIIVPIFNSNEPDSISSNSTLSFNYYTYEERFRGGYSVHYEDERYEACRGKFSMKNLNYKLYCGNDCQYTPKFDLATCKLVCDKFINNAVCLNDQKYYLLRSSIKLDIRNPYYVVSSNEVLIIDSNESSITTSNGDAHVTIDKVISEDEITYYNVESNDDRIFSCSENKDLKENFPAEIDFDQYCDSEEENIIFDLATCQLGCAPKQNKSVDETTEAPTKTITTVKTLSQVNITTKTTSTLLKLPPKTTSRPINVIPKPQEESIIVPIFNSNEPDSISSNSTLSFNYYTYEERFRGGYSVHYEDERYEACRGKFSMKNLNYKLYCGNDCQYTLKFDLATCKLVCDKFINNAVCLNDQKYYLLRSSIKLDIRNPYYVVSSNEVLIIDSNESSITTSNGDAHVTIDKVISEDEITYYNVESNDDRIFSCSENKDLKENFPAETDFDRYCDSEEENIIFDLATCQLGCAPKQNKSVDETTEAPTKTITTVKTLSQVNNVTTKTTSTLLKLPPKTTSRPINVIPKPQEESIIVPIFNSNEPDSISSNSTLSFNYYTYEERFRGGYSVHYEDERYEACRGKFSMKNLNYKLYCGNDCQYTPKFDLATCKLVCDKFSNNAVCLNDEKYYLLRSSIKLDIRNPYYVVSSNEVLIIDSNESSITTSNGDAHVTIDKVISEDEITYYNVESNDDRIFSCSENKDLKENFPAETDFDRYCDSEEENIIFDLATCQLGCASK